MPATIDSKGIASGYSDAEDGWGAQMNQNLRQISAYLLTAFAQDVTTTNGLTYGYKGGFGVTPGGLVSVAANTITVGPSTTTYIVRNAAGVVSITTNPSYPGLISLAVVVSNVSTITSVTDIRSLDSLTQDGIAFMNALITSGTPALSGAIRMGNNQSIVARNFANGADQQLLGLNNLNQTILSATGQLTKTGGDFESGIVNALRFVAANPAAPNGVDTVLLGLRAGSDGVLNPVYYQITTVPTAVGANRLVVTQIGDAAALRDYAIKSARMYVGQNAPTFLASEQLRVEGEFRASTVVVPGNISTGGQFNGSGAGLASGSVPLTSVDSLIANLNALYASAATALATNNAQDAAIATKITTGAAIPGGTISGAGSISVNRIAFDWANLGYTGTSTGSRGFNTILPDLPAAGASYNQAAQQEIIDQINTIGDCLRQLAFDLEDRALI